MMRRDAPVSILSGLRYTFILLFKFILNLSKSNYKRMCITTVGNRYDARFSQSFFPPIVLSEFFDGLYSEGERPRTWKWQCRKTRVVPRLKALSLHPWRRHQ